MCSHFWRAMRRAHVMGRFCGRRWWGPLIQQLKMRVWRKTYGFDFAQMKMNKDVLEMNKGVLKMKKDVLEMNKVWHRCTELTVHKKKAIRLCNLCRKKSGGLLSLGWRSQSGRLGPPCQEIKKSYKWIDGWIFRFRFFVRHLNKTLLDFL